MYFLLDGGDEVFAVRGFEGFRGLDLFCVANVIFRVEEGVDCLGAHDVCVGYRGVVVGREESRWGVLAIHDCA